MTKRMGRPSKPPTPGELAPLSVRITATLKEKVQSAADTNGRSISAEVESRLEDSFNKDEVEAMMEEVRTIREQTKMQVQEIKEQIASLAIKASGERELEARAQKAALFPVKGKRPSGSILPATSMKRTKRDER
jgi:Arc-like DNA binding domain